MASRHLTLAALTISSPSMSPMKLGNPRSHSLACWHLSEPWTPIPRLFLTSRSCHKVSSPGSLSSSKSHSELRNSTQTVVGRLDSREGPRLPLGNLRVPVPLVSEGRMRMLLAPPRLTLSSTSSSATLPSPLGAGSRCPGSVSPPRPSRAVTDPGSRSPLRWGPHPWGAGRLGRPPTEPLGIRPGSPHKARRLEAS